MSNLISIGICPHCDGGHRTGCYAEYVDGYKCFSCGISKSYNSHRMAVMGKAAFKPITTAKDMYVPEHVRDPNKFSPHILKWLYSYYVFDDIIKKHSISYVPDAGGWGDSILLPVIKNNEMVFVTRRFFPEKRVVGIGKKQSYNIKTGGERVVVVEDFISAIRVSKFVDVICLFGTYLSKEDVLPVLKDYKNITFWLDGDDAGKKGVKNITKQLNYKINELNRRFPLQYVDKWTINVINTNEDPKTYSPREIERYLNESK